MSGLDENVIPKCPHCGETIWHLGTNMWLLSNADAKERGIEYDFCSWSRPSEDALYVKYFRCGRCNSWCDRNSATGRRLYKAFLSYKGKKYVSSLTPYKTEVWEK